MNYLSTDSHRGFASIAQFPSTFRGAGQINHIATACKEKVTDLSHINLAKCKQRTLIHRSIPMDN